MSSIDEVKTRTDIIELASEAGVKLRRSGRTYTGFCPFHINTRTPAFVIWPESGTWRCFGECNDGGDVFKFLMKKENIDFREALTRLAQRAGVQLEEFHGQRPEQKEENQRLRTLLEDAVTFYRHQLLNTPAGKPALDYLTGKRKLTLQTIEAFGLGYAPHSWDATLKHFAAKGYGPQDLLDVGLLTERMADPQSPNPGAQSPGVYDKFRHRIMIPIRDADGKMTGFGGRILDPNDIPKFMNSPQTVLFDKGRLLYGLDRARKPIRAADQVVIVEGYLDVIAVYQAGFENVVSPMGTALTEDQIRLLKRFTRRIVLALDPDAAGQKAVLRGLDAARASMDREGEIGFDARGLIRNEARLQADLRVATMPDELDPDEIVQRDPQEWAKLIDAAKPIVEHVLETLLADKNVNEPKVKAEVAAQVLPLIEDLPSAIERDSYRQMLARRLRVDERSLHTRPATGSQVRRRRPGPPPHSPPSSHKVQREVGGRKEGGGRPPSHITESGLLALLLRRPDLLPHLDRRLQESSLGPLSQSDFEYTDHQMILQLVQQSLEQDEAEQAHYVEAHLDETLRETYTALMAHQPPKGASVSLSKGRDDRLLDELTRQMIQLRESALRENITQLSFMDEEAQKSDNPSYKFDLQQLRLQYARMKSRLDNARSKMNGYRRG